MSFMRSLGIADIEQFKEKKDVKKLIKALGYKKDPKVCQTAAAALGEIGDPQAVKPLIAALEVLEGNVRKTAAESLVKIGSTAIEPLIASLADEKYTAKNSVAWALGEISDPRAVEPLISMLKKCNSSEIVAKALTKIGSPAVNSLINTFINATWSETRGWAVWALGKIRDSQAVAPLISSLNDEDINIRSAAARILGEFGDPRAVEPLIAALRNEDGNLRKEAFNALVRIGTPSVEPLISQLNQYHSARAVEALGRIGDPRAVEPLIAVLNDDEISVRTKAAQALGKIGNARAVKALIATLNNSKLWFEPRQWSAWALGKIADTQAVGALIATLKDQNDAVHDAAVEALVKIGSSAISPLINALNNKNKKIREEAASVLDKLDWQPDQGTNGAAYWIVREKWDQCIQVGPQAVEPLITALTFDDQDIRREVANALGKISDPRALVPLIELFLTDKELAVRQNAAYAIVDLYQSGQLDENQKQRILEKREIITNNHTDFLHDHLDSGSGGCHVDKPNHTDKDISVDFPL